MRTNPIGVAQARRGRCSQFLRSYSLWAQLPSLALMAFQGRQEELQSVNRKRQAPRSPKQTSIPGARGRRQAIVRSLEIRSHTHPLDKPVRRICDDGSPVATPPGFPIRAKVQSDTKEGNHGKSKGTSKRQ